MAKYKNVAGEPRWVPLIQRELADGEEFEVDDIVARQNDFGAAVFEEIEAPAKVEPPADDAPRSVWIEHAVEVYGARPSTLEALDQSDLVERFGDKVVEVVPPSPTAPRDQWVAFAVEHAGATEADLVDFDRDEIVDGLGYAVPDPEEPAPPAHAVPAQPAKNASLEAWQAYARAIAPDDNIEDLGRDDLATKYGKE